MSDFRVRAVIGVVCNIVLLVLTGTSFTDKYVKRTFSLGRKIVLHSSKQVPTLASTIYHNTIRIRMTAHKMWWWQRKSEPHPWYALVRSKKIVPILEGLVLVTIDAKQLVQVRAILQWETTQLWTIDTDIIDELPSQPLNVIVLSLTIAPLCHAKQQRITTALLPPSAIVYKKYDEHSAYILRPVLHDGVNLVLYQPHVDKLQQMTNHEQVKRKNEDSLKTERASLWSPTSIRDDLEYCISRRDNTVDNWHWQRKLLS